MAHEGPQVRRLSDPRRWDRRLRGAGRRPGIAVHGDRQRARRGEIGWTPSSGVELRRPARSTRRTRIVGAESETRAFPGGLMAGYVDGFAIAVPRKNVGAYKRMATWGRNTWMKHGALQYFECVGDDLEVTKGCGPGFPKGIGAKPGETVVFAFILYKSKAHRDVVNAKVMKDPGMAKMPARIPFDMKRFLFGGFKVLVEG